MDIDLDEPQPDVMLICANDQEVAAHSALLVLASSPLRPAVAMALKNQVDGTNDGVRLNLPEDSADAWLLALQFLDPNAANPRIDWATVEPLLRVSHKYSLRVPLDACLAFLEEVYGRALLESALDEQQQQRLAALRHWVCVSSELGLPRLHQLTSTALASNLVDTLMYTRAAGGSSKGNYCSYGGGSVCSPTSSCRYCKEQHGLKCFRHIWKGGAMQGSVTAEEAAAALHDFGHQELRHMLVSVLMSAL